MIPYHCDRCERLFRRNDGSVLDKCETCAEKFCSQECLKEHEVERPDGQENECCLCTKFASKRKFRDSELLAFATEHYALVKYDIKQKYDIHNASKICKSKMMRFADNHMHLVHDDIAKHYKEYMVERGELAHDPCYYCKNEDCISDRLSCCRCRMCSWCEQRT